MSENRIKKDNSLIKLAFSVYSSPGVYALLLGSGTSRSAEILTGWEVMLDLIRRIGRVNGVNELDNPVQWYQEEFGRQPSYDVLLNKLTSSQAERRDLLSEYFEPRGSDLDEGRKIPQEAHRAIASLVKSGYIKLIITTNFDRLIETALYDLGIHPYVIFHESGIRSCPPPAHIQHSCIIYKIHGDYLDTQLRNTPEELAEYPYSVNRYLDRILDEFGLITCGWSGEYDKALVERIKARSNDAQYPIYITYRGEKKTSIQELLNIPKAIPIEINDADGFFENLNESVNLLSEYNIIPFSDELLLLRVKKYLSDSKYQIRLWELINSESKIAQDNNNQETVNVLSKTSLIVKDVMHNYERNTHNLVNICTNIAFFGDDVYSKSFTSVIERLLSVQEKGSYNDLVSLQYYPALFIVYITGLILIKEEKFSCLAGLILHPAYYNYQVREPCISIINTRKVFPGSYAKQVDIPNASTIYSPVSEYLYQKIREPISGFFSNELQYAEYFDLFEFFISLIYIDQKYSDLTGKRILVPDGRYRWRRDYYSDQKTPFYPNKIRQWINQGDNHPLFKSGFFQESSKRMDLCNKCLLSILLSSNEYGDFL